MRALIDNNKLSIQALGTTAKDLNISSKLILKRVKLNFKYEDGQKTDQFLDTTISVVDPQNYASLDIHVTGKIDISQEELEKADEIVYIQIEPSLVNIKPYKIEYGKVLCTISTASVTVHK